MARYRNIQSDLEGPFATIDWTGLGITAIPVGYEGTTSESTEFVRINIINGQTVGNLFSGNGITGVVRIDIFVSRGAGTTRVNEIADILDSLFQGKTFDNGTQTRSSSLSPAGPDPDNQAFFRANYVVPFTHHS